MVIIWSRVYSFEMSMFWNYRLFRFNKESLHFKAILFTFNTFTLVHWPVKAAQPKLGLGYSVTSWHHGVSRPLQCNTTDVPFCSFRSMLHTEWTLRELMSFSLNLAHIPDIHHVKVLERLDDLSCEPLGIEKLLRLDIIQLAGGLRWWKMMIT